MHDQLVQEAQRGLAWCCLSWRYPGSSCGLAAVRALPPMLHGSNIDGQQPGFHVCLAWDMLTRAAEGQGCSLQGLCSASGTSTVQMAHPSKGICDAK